MASLKSIIKSKFDYDVSDLTAYVDDQQAELVTRSVSEAVTLNYIRTQEGVKGSQDIKLLNDEVIYQAADCDMTDQGDTVFSDRKITTVAIGFKKGFCNKDLDGFWTQLALRPGAMAEDKELPFEQAITDYLLKLNAVQLDKLIWQGNTATGTGNLQWFNGFKTILTVANGCIDLNPSDITSITNSNAYDIFYGCYSNMSDAIMESDEKIAFTSRGNFDKLMKNLVDLNFFHYSPAAIAAMNEVIIPGTDLTVVKTPGLAGATEIFVGKRSHFVFGTDLATDSASYELWYSQDDDKLYIRSKMRGGVQVPFTNEIGVFKLHTA